MKIGVDIDNTLVALQEGFCKFYKLKYNGYLSVDDCEKYWLSEVLNIPKEKEYPLWKEYHDSDLFDEIDFMDGAKEVINTLKQKNKIIFITSRHLEWKQKTLDFIKKHFPADNFQIIFSGDVYGGKCKEEICRELDIPVIIEDHHEKSIDYANA
ncbi:MAG: hypothetical protein KKE50_00770, partial [Nanoarchaeota archaeon]|nr:hypothetical protein [Nanoarchaeota archaeon]